MLNIKRTGAEDYGRFIKALVCGDPGTGKTLISSTFPDPFYLTTEGLLMSVYDRGIPYHVLKSTDELLQTVTMLQQTPRVRAAQFGFPVNTIVIDTIDDVSRLFMREHLAKERHDTPQLQDYGWLKGQMDSVVTALRNLDMNVVLTCHLKAKEVAGVSSLWPSIEGGFSEAIPGYVDLAVVLKTRLGTAVVGQETVRVVQHYMQTVQDPQHTWIKDHSHKLPAEFDLNFDDDYDRMATLIYGAPQVVTLEDDEPEAPVTEVVTEAAPAKEELTVQEGSDQLQIVSEPRFTCTSCSAKFDDENQRDLSQIKFRAVLCKDCTDAKSQKRKS